MDAVHPRYVIFTAGYLNRFGHPQQDIAERYRKAGSEMLRSDEDGAISIAMDSENFRVDRYRSTHARYWQHGAKASEADL